MCFFGTETETQHVYKIEYAFPKILTEEALVATKFAFGDSGEDLMTHFRTVTGDTHITKENCEKIFWENILQLHPGYAMDLEGTMFKCTGYPDYNFAPTSRCCVVFIFLFSIFFFYSFHVIEMVSDYFLIWVAFAHAVALLVLFLEKSSVFPVMTPSVFCDDKFCFFFFLFFLFFPLTVA